MNMRGIPQYTLVWGAHYTLGARYLSKNTVLEIQTISITKKKIVLIMYQHILLPHAQTQLTHLHVLSFLYATLICSVMPCSLAPNPRPGFHPIFSSICWPNLQASVTTSSDMIIAYILTLGTVYLKVTNLQQTPTSVSGWGMLGMF